MRATILPSQHPNSQGSPCKVSPRSVALRQRIRRDACAIRGLGSQEHTGKALTCQRGASIPARRHLCSLAAGHQQSSVAPPLRVRSHWGTSCKPSWNIVLCCEGWPFTVRVDVSKVAKHLYTRQACGCEHTCTAQIVQPNRSCMTIRRCPQLSQAHAPLLPSSCRKSSVAALWPVTQRHQTSSPRDPYFS